jgi:hypothetical protein
MEEDEPNPDSSLPRWVLLEYSHMLSLAGKEATVAFTHLSASSCSVLSGALNGNNLQKVIPLMF